MPVSELTPRMASVRLESPLFVTSKVFLMRKEPLSMTLELLKAMRWSNDHVCFATFDPLAHVLTFLIYMSFLTSFKATAGFALEKLWRLGTRLPPSVLTIILSRFQTSIIFVSKVVT